MSAPITEKVSLEQWGERYRAEIVRICMAYDWGRADALEAAENNWEAMDKLSIVLSDSPEEAAEGEVEYWENDGE